MKVPDKIVLKDLLEPYVPREDYDEEDIKGLAQSIVLRGLEHNLGINIIPQGLKLIYGSRRLKALEYLGIETIPSVKYPHITLDDIKFYDNVSEKEALHIAMDENKQRKNMTPFLEAKTLNRLPKKEWLEQGYSESYVQQRLSLLNRLKPSLLPHVRYGTHDYKEDSRSLTFAKARLIWNLPHEDQQYIFRYVIRRKGMTTEELRAYVQKILNKRAYLDTPTTHEDLNLIKQEAKKKYYGIKEITKISLAKLKDEIEPYSVRFKAIANSMHKKLLKSHKKQFFRTLCEVEGLGVLEVAIDVKNLISLIKVVEKGSSWVIPASIYLSPYTWQDEAHPEYEKLEPYGYTLVNDKIVKTNKEDVKFVDVEKILVKTPERKFEKLVRKQLAKKQRDKKRIRKSSVKHDFKFMDKFYRVTPKDLNEFQKACEERDLKKLKRWEEK